MRHSWVIKGFTMRMFKWDENFNPKFESSIAPVWIRFPQLPLFFYDDEALLDLANTIGKPLKIDPLNQNRVKLGEAGVYVELDVSKNPKDKIWIGFNKKGDNDKLITVEGFWQLVTYERCPIYCDQCKHLGHTQDKCKVRRQFQNVPITELTIFQNAELEDATSLKKTLICSTLGAPARLVHHQCGEVIRDVSQTGP
ncbi:hypothetical protein LIER_43876 [Lithospermum erythrorhizon]|uniref:DUF4283 domain-containing protein n=1 Tax=Lithospermum erythrorhizon TaxID=34254 RepID=A0AAV3R3D9_LITER